jgi:hypothetical protein
LCLEEYALQEAIEALPPLLEIIPAPAAATRVPTAPNVRPPELPPRATEQPIIPIVTTFQTDGGGEPVEDSHQSRLSESFANPATDPATVSTKPSVSARPPALPVSTQPHRAASTAPQPAMARLAQSAPAQPLAAQPADEPWMSEAIGGQKASRQRRKKRSSLSFFLQYILGGAVGLALAVAILFWVFKVDLLNLANHLPAFMVPEQLVPKDSQPA